MLRRLMSWCVPATALELRAPKQPEPELTDVEQVLALYKEETEVGGYRTTSTRLSRS